MGQKLNIATLSVQGGLNSDDLYGNVVPAIHLSSTYRFYDFNQPRSHDYSRRSNPTRDIVQKTLATLEEGSGAILTNSGMSAIHLLTTMLLTPNDRLLAPHDCYGGSYRLFDSLQQRSVYQVSFVNQQDRVALCEALAQKPKLVLIESPSNPLLNVVDIQEISQLAHQHGALVAVDNTFLSPVLQKPLTLGADFVIHSCTKYLNGHSDSVTGAIIAKNTDMAEELAWWGNNIGVTAAAFDSYLLLRGLRTLVPRVRQQQKNAELMADFLTKQKRVKRVYYPGLANHPGHAIACKQQQGFGAMLSFELMGDEQTLRTFLANLKLLTLAESLGGVESLISHAATMTHAGMTAEARAVAGISDMLLRISVGLEEIDDLLADLQRGFDAIG